MRQPSPCENNPPGCYAAAALGLILFCLTIATLIYLQLQGLL